MTPDAGRTGRFLTAEWRSLLMVNFQVDAAVLTPYVPAGTEIDFFNGRTFLSVVGFRFLRASVLGIPIPFHRRFDEVNLRFYVRRRVGSVWRRGVVFLKEIVRRRLVAYMARRFYYENYVVMPMRSQVALPLADGAAGALVYQWHCGERWHSLSAQIQGGPALAEMGSEEEFITEHYWGYTRRPSGTTLEYQVEHPRWRVWKAVSASFEGDAARLYAAPFIPFLAVPPTSALVADGSAVLVRKGRPID